MRTPTIKEIDEASRIQICRWHRFLPLANNEEELKITNHVYKRFIELGGMTPSISKAIGWD